MKKNARLVCDILLFVIVFALLQLIATAGINFIVADVGASLAWATIVSGMLTIALFLMLRWSPLETFRRRPLKECAWVALFALALLMPSEWLQELLDIEVSDELTKLMESLIRQPLGFVAVGVIAPVAEEIVFRGAILRRCLEGIRSPWTAIAISALAFAIVHGNMAQGVHAFLMGLILGWLFLRTKSLVPGIILHWVNNSVVFLQCNLFDLGADAKLIDLFGGNLALMCGSLVVSAAVAVFAFLKIRKNQRGLTPFI